MEKDEEKSYDSSNYYGNRVTCRFMRLLKRNFQRCFRRKGESMNEVNELMNEIARKLPDTKEYNQYKNLLDRLRAKPDLYRRVGEFRRRSIGVQLGDRGNAIHANNELQNEFRDLQNNGLVNDFFVAEHQYCRMIRDLQEILLESAQIETGFLEE